MSEQKYITMKWSDNPNKGTFAVRESESSYRELDTAEIVALLNTPPQHAGIAWRKPGEAGRVDGKMYFVWCDNELMEFRYSANAGSDGWATGGVVAWAEPSPPAWATGGAA